MAAIHHGICNLCDASCGLEIEHEGGRILSIRGDAADPVSRTAAKRDASDRAADAVPLEGPRYIVVEGPIGVGKTSLAKRLAKSFASCADSARSTVATPTKTCASAASEMR